MVCPRTLSGMARVDLLPVTRTTAVVADSPLPRPVPPQDRSVVVADRDGIRIRLHARRLRGDLTLANAAERVGLRREELARIERGDTVQMRFDTLAKLMSGYRCTLADLLEAERTDPAPAQPLYSGALGALASGALTSAVGRRRAVVRSTELDDVTDGEREDFRAREPDQTAPRDRSRRAPVGTARR